MHVQRTKNPKNYEDILIMIAILAQAAHSSHRRRRVYLSCAILANIIIRCRQGGPRAQILM